jgi:hypothetical protein
MTDMQPVQFLTTPGYSSDDPATEGLVMIAVDDVPTKGETGASTDPADRKAADWVDAVEAAQDQDALDAISQQYEDSGKDLSTVDKAIEKRQDELDA